MANETPSRPPPLHGKCHLKFPFWLFDYFPYPASLHLKSLLCISTLLPNALICAVHASLRAWRTRRRSCGSTWWSLRSSAHLNFLLHSEELFASPGPTSTRWLFMCASSSFKVWHSSLHTLQEVILSLVLSALSLLSNVTRTSTKVASTSASSSLLLSPRTSKVIASLSLSFS